MERPIYLSRARWAEWEPLFNRTIRPPRRPPPRPPTNKITHCAICLELLRGKNIKIFYKRKYKSVSKSERFNRLHKGLSAYPRAYKIRKLRCFHKFHKRCIEKWFKRSYTCPLCRK